MAQLRNLSIAYLNPATGGTLTARAEELSAGGRMATYAVRVHDEAGVLVADVQAMGYRTKKTAGRPGVDRTGGGLTCAPWASTSD